jgi:hypothetical protein
MSFKKGFVVCLWALSLIFHHAALAQQAAAGGAQQGGLANILGQITPIIQQLRIFVQLGRDPEKPIEDLTLNLNDGYAITRQISKDERETLQGTIEYTDNILHDYLDNGSLTLQERADMARRIYQTQQQIDLAEQR